MLAAALAAALFLSTAPGAVGGNGSEDTRDYPECPASARPKGFERAEQASAASERASGSCTTAGYGEVPENDPDAPVPHTGVHSPATYASPYTGSVGSIYVTDPAVTHPAPSGTFEFVASQLFAFGSQAGGWLEVGWVESDGFFPSTGNAQQAFTFDPNGGGWQLHQTLSPGLFYSFRIIPCDGSYYCAYIFLGGTWGLLRRSHINSACSDPAGCQQAHILVETQSTDSTPHPALNDLLRFDNLKLHPGPILWNTAIPTSETTDSEYGSCWSRKWYRGYAKSGAC